jgi:4,5-dihydroxyphthalate decarboxylase
MYTDRRDFLKASVSAAVSSSILGSTVARADETPAIDLKMAGYPFEHVKGLMTGKVQIDRCTTSFEIGKIGDLNTHIFSGPRTLDVTEVGLSPYMLAFANEEFRAYTLIPVFPLRLFRHKSIFVHADAGIEEPSQLKGRRIATPGYSSTSLTWIRGMLQDEYGIRPEDVEWVVSARDSSTAASGTASAQEQVFPAGLTVKTGPDGKDESDLLVDRDVDALFHAAEPRAFIEGHPKVRRLFADARQVERDYYAKTGIFPIMHAVAIRTNLVEQNPWLPKAVFEGYSASKAMAFADMRQKWFLRTLPWFAQELESTEALMGRNFFPYGVEANRKSLEALFRYSHEQGLASRELKIEEIFEPATLRFTEA